MSLSGFRQFVEDKVNTLSSQKPKPRKENVLDGMWRELGISPNQIPDLMETGPIEMPDEGLWFNQAVWQVIKPIELNDSFVRIKMHKSLSPNLNQRVYYKTESGKMVPYTGDITQRVFLLPIKKFAEIFSRGWQGALQQQGGFGGMS